MKNKLKNIMLSGKTFLALSILAANVGTYADDTEVFYNGVESKPNLMFVLDYSTSMGSTVPGTGGQSRLEVLRSTMRTVLETAPDNINIGIMSYGQGQRARAADYKLADEGNRTHGTNGVAFPLRDINSKANEVVTDDTGVAQVAGTSLGGEIAGAAYLPYVPGPEVTVGEYIADIVDYWGTNHETPIVDSLYEASLYFRGEKMHYGNHQPNEFPGAHPSTYVTDGVTEITSDIDVTPRDTTTAPNYISPIVDKCQANYIVMMSDGAPANRYDSFNENGTWVQYGPSPNQDDISLGGNNTSKKSWKFRGPFAQNMMGNSDYSKLAGEITTCVDLKNANGNVIRTAGLCGPELMQHIANDTTDNK